MDNTDDVALGTVSNDGTYLAWGDFEYFKTSTGGFCRRPKDTKEAWALVLESEVPNAVLEHYA